MRPSELSSHHAVLFVQNDRKNFGDKIWNELSNTSNANVFFNQTVLDIETARNIISWAQQPYNDEKTALISFHTATIPAQNAMLKILEEPRSTVKFILLTSNKNNLIGTVLSRVQYMENKEIKDENLTQAEKFLSTSHSGRMKLNFIIDLLAANDEEGRKDRESVREFTLSLATVLSHEKVAARYITETIEVASYASDPSTSLKQLLEYLALLLPQVK